jgi:hypothetical protein
MQKIPESAENTGLPASVPEYREAIIAMGKAWMKIAERAKI